MSALLLSLSSNRLALPLGLCVVLLAAAVVALGVNHVRNRRVILRLRFSDPVTGGGNAAWFDLQAAQRVERAADGVYTLLLLDINDFKVINDRYGRPSGDRVLRFLHNAFSQFIATDELVARLSADTFGLLLKTSDREILLERLYDMVTLANDFNLSSEEKYFLIFSAGVYEVTDHAIEIQRAIDYARVACRSAKAQSGGGFARLAFFDDGDLQRLRREKDLENRVENALSNHDLRVYLQPKVLLDDNRVAGAEALVRWHDPERGLIPPSDFIYLFERNGFIAALDLYVFREVCAMLRRWLDEGLTPVPVSVNLSRVHLSNPNFLDRYEEIRREYDVPASLLELELTESVVFENLELLQGVFVQMRELGYASSLDDFGSGYSSLNILRSIDVDVIKLDRLFFGRGGDDQGRGRPIIESVIDLAARIGIKTVAEGVEEPEQVAFLKSCRCDMVQGYVFSRPVPIEDFERLAFSGESLEIGG